MTAIRDGANKFDDIWNHFDTMPALDRQKFHYTPCLGKTVGHFYFCDNLTKSGLSFIFFTVKLKSERSAEEA